MKILTQQKKRKRKTKKRQNRSTSRGNEEAEIVPSPWAFPKTSIDGTSTDDDDMPYLHSTGYDKSGASKDEQADCKASEDVILSNAETYSSGAETQPDSKNAHVNIKNEPHGLIIYNMQRAGPTISKPSAKYLKEP